jgi:CRP/FNR family transcriptional regulator
MFRRRTSRIARLVARFQGGIRRPFGAILPASAPGSSAGRGSACQSCALRSGCLPQALGVDELDVFATMVRLKRKVGRSARLFGTGDHLANLYVVRSGTFKTVTISRQGRPKITGFYLPGDVMGLDGLDGRAYTADGVALEPAEVCVVPLHQLESMMGEMPALLKEFVRRLSAEITRDHGLTTLLSCMDAEQRVARFLLSLTERYHRLGYAKETLLLHMTRDDIASYLGLSSETVSRIMTRLRRRGLLMVHQRHVQVTDYSRLTAAAAW